MLQSAMLNEKVSRNIVLVGFMGAGKSLVANKLAKRCQRQIVSTDRLIEEQENKPIAEIFSQKGEAYFRALEKEIVLKIADRKNLIVDCGGGIVINQENIENLRKQGTIFYLFATPEMIYENIKDQKHRPLLQVKDPLEKIRELLDQRKVFYAQADYTIDTCHQSLDQACDEILKIMSPK